jgi:hypothetical protein
MERSGPSTSSLNRLSSQALETFRSLSVSVSVRSRFVLGQDDVVHPDTSSCGKTSGPLLFQVTRMDGGAGDNSCFSASGQS